MEKVEKRKTSLYLPVDKLYEVKKKALDEGTSFNKIIEQAIDTLLYKDGTDKKESKK